MVNKGKYEISGYFMAIKKLFLRIVITTIK